MSNSPQASDTAALSAQMTQMVYGFWVSRCLHAVAELGLADVIGDGSKTAEELAAATGTHPEALRRLLRMLSGLGVMVKDESTQRFGLTPLGTMLRKDSPGSVYGTLLSQGHALSWQAWGELMHSLKTGEPSIEKAMGDTLFGYLSKNPQVAAIFNESMAAYQSLNAPAVVGAYDFSSARRILDVGGGTGALMERILRAHPAAVGGILEMPYVAREARERLAAVGLASRCEVLEGDFFSAIPSGYDVYILSQILHDWSEERCLRILSLCRQAMGPQSKLLVVETVLPGDNEPHFGRLYDMAMLVVTGGQERTQREYDALVAKAGFKSVRTVPTSKPPSVIELVPA